MQNTRRLYLVIVTLGMSLAATHAHAELKSPKVGDRMTWKCSGPYSKRYDLEVKKISDGIVHFEGVLDGKPYWAEKHATLIGTSLWVRLFGDRKQWFDMEDFEAFHKLVPGSRFKGAVPAQTGEDKWVWDYEVSVGQPQNINHPVLGSVTVVPASEERRIFHGDYWSKMTTYLQPDLGLSVSWVYDDPKGTEKCDLVSFTR